MAYREELKCLALSESWETAFSQAERWAEPQSQQVDATSETPFYCYVMTFFLFGDIPCCEIYFDINMASGFLSSVSMTYLFPFFYI